MQEHVWESNLSKYRSRKTEVDGHVFDSLKEANRYCELKMLVKAKAISDLQLQPKFILQEGFEHKAWGKQRPITYIADFYYKENGKPVVEDVKGMRTEVYKIKKKLLLHKYPEIDFREV